MSDLKAYWCTPNDYGDCSDVVFAESRSKAIVAAIRRGESCNDCEFIEVRAVRCPAADKYADCQDELRKSRVWREIGGCLDIGEPRCDTCGLATMDGKWPLCDDCYNCIDCAGPLTETPEHYFVCKECLEIPE